ncbi:serine protease inhibitor 77Ba-like [Bradysia coprophila]|uniref:serine protease inhibitor 77Ba-like n=1 Tax=Bradysia coprophila TaxID=38358 RepID=UPI00187DC82B|nr:serine protease inhibitor 77Ba-like [Bradysia coprophila]
MLRYGTFLLGLILATVTAQNFEQNMAQNALPNDSSKFVPPEQPQPQPPQQPNDSLTAAQQFILQATMQISNGTERFSLELYKRLAIALDELPEGRDFIISPFSVWSLLILTAEGALGNTYAQLQNVMGLPNDLTYIREGYRHIQNSLKVNTTTIELAVEQVMFTDKNRPVELDYEDKLTRVYEADVVPVDFHKTDDAYYEINDYINEKTHGKITKIVQPEDLHDLQMVLVSAIFFKGEWKFPFDKQDTREEPFYDENGNNLGTVNMMSQKGAFGYAAHAALQAHVLELPYGNEDRLSMYVLLPRKGLRLSAVIENIANVGIAKIMADIEAAQAKYEDDEVEVFMPRIRITSDFTLNMVLEQMGLVDIFDANTANLTGIAKYAPYLSRIIHKAKVEVTEEGTVAAAVTGGTFVNKNSPSRFYANRPFAFLIVEKRSKLLLFSGQVKNPTQDKF